MLEVLVTTRWTVEQAYAHCRELTIRHYENFPVGSWCVPRAMQRHYYSIYAFARTADDFSDERRDQPQQFALLDDWERRLRRCLDDPEDHPVFVALAQTMRECELPIEWLADLLQAFRMDVTVKRYATFDDVLGYCRYSANPVGRLILALFGYRDAERQRQSDAICTALQLANFWQDVAIDLKKDRIYVPLEDQARFGASEETLRQHELTEAVRELLAYQVERTWRLFAEGAPLPSSVGRRLGWELRCVWWGGTRILERIAANGYDVFRRRPTLTTTDKLGMVFRALTSQPLERRMAASAGRQEMCAHRQRSAA